MPSQPAAEPKHIDLYDKTKRTSFASLHNVSDKQLRRAVAMVGTRISTLSAYLRKPS